MSAARHVLFVEGDSDKLFFEVLVKEKFGLSVEIEPKHGIDKITKSLVEDKLMHSLRDGQIERLAIVADADNCFDARWQQLTQPLAHMGYQINPPPCQPFLGSILSHNNGLPNVGLWLMPDHQHDGMLEDLIQQTIDLDEQCQLLATAKHCLQQLPCTLFKPHHYTKATVYTWLAWQKKPGQALVSTINAKLIELDAQPLHAFQTWLRKVFI